MSNDEWFTPPEIIEIARRVMDGINLDPASCVEANKIVGAYRFYDKEHDGLKRLWDSTVWLNPPYSRDLVGAFVEKLIASLPTISQACVLVNNATDTRWCQALMTFADVTCFLKKRVRFVRPGGGREWGPRQGQILFYFGGRIIEFVTEARRIGAIYRS